MDDGTTRFDDVFDEPRGFPVKARTSDDCLRCGSIIERVVRLIEQSPSTLNLIA